MNNEYFTVGRTQYNAAGENKVASSAGKSNFSQQVSIGAYNKEQYPPEFRMMPVDQSSPLS